MLNKLFYQKFARQFKIIPFPDRSLKYIMVENNNNYPMI